MDWENFNARKYVRLIKIVVPLIAFLFIIFFIFLPLVMHEVALQKEAEEKGTPVHYIWNINLF